MRKNAIKFWNKKVEPAILKAANKGEDFVSVDTPFLFNEGDVIELALELGYDAEYSLSLESIEFSW